jgi:chromosome segregation ATPase
LKGDEKMVFTKRMSILISAAVGLLIAGITAGSLWSNHKVASLERQVMTAKEHSDLVEKSAADKEMQSTEYKAKIEYLEGKLAEFSATARRQDEELQKLETNTAAARDDVERARRVRSIAATADELCGKLQELGHACAQ